MYSNTLETVGADWLCDQVDEFTESVDYTTPVEWNETHRYLPSSVTSMPGPLSFDINPFMREIVDCFDVNSPVREVNLKKGVQITYSTAIESGAFYYMAKVTNLPMMYMTADKELATARIESNFIPMLNDSGFDHIIQAHDTTSSHKTGKTAKKIEHKGGGYLVPFGAINANKMRAVSIAVMLKDEIDAWPWRVGKDGCPDKLSDARLKGFWDRRKIFRGSTPLIKGQSKIEIQYNRGDKRKYYVPCKHCGHKQELRWSTINEDTGVVGGFTWEIIDGTLDLDSVRYRCCECGGEHDENDKASMFAEKGHGGEAEWIPTARPVEPGIRSYHLPAFYSPIGMCPWSALVSDYLECYDPETKKVIDIEKYQVFYNNVLAEPFEVMGSKVSFVAVSAHRRSAYRMGTIPNEYAKEYSGSPILFLTCQADLHDSFLSVGVFGWCKDSKPYVIDYFNLEPNAEEKEKGILCTDADCSIWETYREFLEEKTYTADDGKVYKIQTTAVDAGYANSTVVDFCAQFASGVIPILGRDETGKKSAIKEFAEWTTSAGTLGYRLNVDHYKDRNAPVLRREWHEGAGLQKRYHFNAPIDISDKSLKELTVEYRRKKVDARGKEFFEWHRPGNARNELWDLLQYGHALVEIIAVNLCMQIFELETVDWNQFWEYIEKEELYFDSPEVE